MSKNKILFFLFSVLLLCIVVLFLLFRKRPDEQISKLTLGIGTWPGFCSGMVGMERELFEGIELDHKVLDDAPARHAAFQSGDIDIMISSIDVFAQEAAQGIKAKIFLVTDESLSDGIVTSSGIETPKDLKGKKVAFALGTPSHFLLYKVLEMYSILPSDIKEIKVDDPGHAAQAFLGGSVDAAVTWEPFLTEVKEKGKGRVLITTRDYPGIIVDVLVASEEIQRRGDLLHRFIDGWIRSVEYIKEHPDESLKIIARGLNIKSEDVEGMMEGLRFAGQARNAEFFCTIDHSDTKIAEILKEAAHFWKSQGIITAIPPVANLISSISTEYFCKDRK